MYKKPEKPSTLFEIIEHFLTLPFGRKVLFIFAIIGFISLFLPWFYEGLRLFNIFGKFTIIGFMLSLFSSFIILISIRETFFYKKYFLKLPNYYAFLLLLIIGLYTLILQTSALYELLNYNPQARISFGGMLLFFSYGFSLFGLLISKNYIPEKPKEKKQKDAKDVNISNISLQVEKYNT